MDNSLDQDAHESLETAEVPASATSSPNPQRPHRRFRFSRRKLIVGVVVIMLIIGGLVGFFHFKKPAKKAPESVTINTQSLDNGTLNQLEGDANNPTSQNLTIEPVTIFKNNVTVQGAAEIAKNLNVDGTATIQGSTNINSTLAVAKSLTVGGSLTVNGSITGGSLSVGSITISSINVSGDLAFGGHIIPSGSQPTVKASTAAAGGTVSISGNDTAGTVTITTGGGTQAAGEMAIITFHTAFGATPKVQLTPVSSGASQLPYFVTHTSGFFTINSSAAPAANTTYIFDYLTTQ